MRRGNALAALSLLAAAACHSSAPQTKTSAEVLLNERMAAVLLRQEQPVDAERAYRDVIKDDPNNPDLYDGLGSALLMQGRFHEALDQFDHAVKLNPNKPSYRINRGLALVELGKYAEAEADFKVADASAVPEDRIAAAINRGRLRQMQGDFAGAEAEYTIALNIDAGSFAARLGRGVAREAQGELAGAAEDYLEAVRLQPRSADANLRLGLTLLEMKKASVGCRYLERAVEIDPVGDAGSKARVVLEATPPPCDQASLHKAA